MEEKNTTYPLIIVFYLDRETMSQENIMKPFVESVNQALHIRKSNALAFFLPAAKGDKERVECINPQIIPEIDMEKINKLVEDIKKQFDIGQGADEDIDNPQNEIEITKECTCVKGETECSNCNK